LTIEAVGHSSELVLRLYSPSQPDESLDIFIDFSYVSPTSPPEIREDQLKFPESKISEVKKHYFYSLLFFSGDVIVTSVSNSAL
jgi:hypothetical protein